MIKEQEQGATSRCGAECGTRLDELMRVLLDVRAGRSDNLQIPTAGGGQVKLLVTPG